MLKIDVIGLVTRKPHDANKTKTQAQQKTNNSKQKELETSSSCSVNSLLISLLSAVILETEVRLVSSLAGMAAATTAGVGAV